MKKENEENSRYDQVETDDDQENEEMQDWSNSALDFEDSPKFKKILSDDEKYLDEFQLSMEQKGLSKKTIQKHLSNVAFFLEDFLLYYEAEPMQEGIYLISSFLGDWFIRKAAWSSQYTIKENITSIKKFYKCMLDNGNISKQDYSILLETIKEEKSEWLHQVWLYDNDFDNYYNDYFI